MPDLTLDDIARMAGVSPSTVSRVLNNLVGTRSKARARVLKVLGETGFQPNAAARSLASQRSHVIGLLVPAPASTVLHNPTVLQLAELVTQSCHERGYLLSLFLLGSGDDEQLALPKITRRGFVDGIIVRGADDRASEPLLRRLSASGVPFVALGRPGDLEHISYVAVDNTSAAHTATSHLLSHGRRRVALLVGSLETFASQERLAGYRNALADRRIAFDEDLVAAAGMHNGYSATQQLLQQQPDAIFLPTRMALDVLRAISNAGLRVPADIALVGFEDLPLAQQTDPPLTVVRQPMPAMSKHLVGMLLDIMENGTEPPRRVVFPQELFIRQSCGALPA